MRRTSVVSTSDRRPWLILSRREVRVLVDSALHSLPPQSAVPPELAQVLRMVALQERWINGGRSGMRGTAERALRRE